MSHAAKGIFQKHLFHCWHLGCSSRQLLAEQCHSLKSQQSSYGQCQLTFQYPHHTDVHHQTVTRQWHHLVKIKNGNNKATYEVTLGDIMQKPGNSRVRDGSDLLGWLTVLTASLPVPRGTRLGRTAAPRIPTQWQKTFPGPTLYFQNYVTTRACKSHLGSPETSFCDTACFLPRYRDKHLSAEKSGKAWASGFVVWGCLFF